MSIQFKFSSQKTSFCVLLPGLLLILAFLCLPSFCRADNDPWEAQSAWIKDNFDFYSQTAPPRLLYVHGWDGENRPYIYPDNDCFKECPGYPGENCCGILRLDPASGQIEMAGKFVEPQDQGRHMLEFRVKVTGATEPSLAKIEVRNNISSWGKKFQIYFGSKIRVNYSPDPDDDVTIIPENEMEMDRWYHIRFEIDLDTDPVNDLMNVYVDGKPVTAAPVQIVKGPIVSLVVCGWDRPGAVYLDDIFGTRVMTSPTVDITAPVPGSTVSGTVPVTVDVSSDVTDAYLYIDGALAGSVNAAPFQFNWDTTANYLPAPNHPMDIGYYATVGVEGSARLGYTHVNSAMDEVDCYTNLFIASRAFYKYENENWETWMDQDLAKAVSQGKRIELCLLMNGKIYTNYRKIDKEHPWNILEIARPYWDHIARIEIAHEPNDWGVILLREQIEVVKAKLIEKNLPYRPLGITHHPNANNFKYLVKRNTLDWIGIEAYLQGPGSPVSSTNVSVLEQFMLEKIALVSEEKDIVLVMMAYDRNGCWKNINTLRDLQVSTYLLAHNRPRIIGLNIFAHKRDSDLNPLLYEQLWPLHKMIAEKILGTPGFTCPQPYSNGKHTIQVEVKAGTESASQYAIADVAN